MMATGPTRTPMVGQTDAVITSIPMVAVGGGDGAEEFERRRRRATQIGSVARHAVA
jgi:hypothetical protein